MGFALQDNSPSFFTLSFMKIVALFLTAGVGFFSSLAFSQNVIKIGEINSYKAQPAFLEPYKKGMELAVDEINAAGGVNGKKLQLITRDDNASPGDAVRASRRITHP
jgi:branched-chain amino acid transport system substrate-binding protein